MRLRSLLGDSINELINEWERINEWNRTGFGSLMKFMSAVATKLKADSQSCARRPFVYSFLFVDTFVNLFELPPLFDLLMFFDLLGWKDALVVQSPEPEIDKQCDGTGFLNIGCEVINHLGDLVVGKQV